MDLSDVVVSTILLRSSKLRFPTGRVLGPSLRNTQECPNIIQVLDAEAGRGGGGSSVEVEGENGRFVEKAPVKRYWYCRSTDKRFVFGAVESIMVNHHKILSCPTTCLYNDPSEPLGQVLPDRLLIHIVPWRSGRSRGDGWLPVGRKGTADDGPDHVLPGECVFGRWYLGWVFVGFPGVFHPWRSFWDFWGVSAIYPALKGL